MDFALIFVIAAAVTGAIWAVDAWVFAPKRALGADGELPPEPVVVEYARSFFPIIVIVLIFRSFVFEPFRIPSASMEPTLRQGDFILVNKFDYGLRLPVLNTKIMPLGEPERGDVVVFRLPSDPGTHYIKRLVGLPGDRVAYVGKQLRINGELIPLQPQPHPPGKYGGRSLLVETLGDVTHNVLLNPDPGSTNYRGTIPDGHYFMMGDNRDNSKDSRFKDVGLIPEDHLVGRAVRIWMNFSQLGRIGDKIT